MTSFVLRSSGSGHSCFPHVLSSVCLAVSARVSLALTPPVAPSSPSACLSPSLLSVLCAHHLSGRQPLTATHSETQRYSPVSFFKESLHRWVRPSRTFARKNPPHPLSTAAIAPSEEVRGLETQLEARARGVKTSWLPRRQRCFVLYCVPMASGVDWFPGAKTSLRSRDKCQPVVVHAPLCRRLGWFSRVVRRVPGLCHKGYWCAVFFPCDMLSDLGFTVKLILNEPVGVFFSSILWKSLWIIRNNCSLNVRCHYPVKRLCLGLSLWVVWDYLFSALLQASSGFLSFHWVSFSNFSYSRNLSTASTFSGMRSVPLYPQSLVSLLRCR